MADHISLALFVGAFSSLITIVNPFSTASIFVTITSNNTKKERYVIAKKACFTGTLVLIIMALGGSYILSFFSISIEAFRIAGGILIAGLGLQMLHAGKLGFQTQAEEKEATKKEDPSVIPLAIPFLSGPGAITTTIVLMGATSTVLDISLILVAIVLVMLISFLVLTNAERVVDHLGKTGKSVVDKVMGLIVLVVGVQFIINGLNGLIVSWF